MHKKHNGDRPDFYVIAVYWRGAALGEWKFYSTEEAALKVFRLLPSLKLVRYAVLTHGFGRIIKEKGHL